MFDWEIIFLTCPILLHERFKRLMTLFLAKTCERRKHESKRKTYKRFKFAGSLEIRCNIEGGVKQFWQPSCQEQ